MKTRNAKHILAFLLLFAMLFSMLGSSVYAAEEAVAYRPVTGFTEGMVHGVRAVDPLADGVHLADNALPLLEGAGYAHLHVRSFLCP